MRATVTPLPLRERNAKLAAIFAAVQLGEITLTEAHKRMDELGYSRAVPVLRKEQGAKAA